MAYSSSIKPAQVVKLCELCNQDNIKWRCIDCDRCLCQKCKTIHLNVPVTAKHQIVTIATPIHDVVKRIVTDNIPCKDHGTKMNCLFCETCNCLVCPECVSTSHTNHKFIPIEKILDNKLEQLKGMQRKVNGNLKFCDSKTLETQNLMSKCNSIFDESVTKIKEKEQELKAAISMYSKVLQERVEVKRSKVKTTVTKAQQQIDKSKNKLEDLKQELETVRRSNQGQVIFEANPTEPILEFDNLPHKFENFIPVADMTIQKQELFGSFKEVTIHIAQFGFEVLKHFSTDISEITQVIPLDEKSAWINCYKSDKPQIRKISIQNNNIVKLKEIPMTFIDITLTSENDILLTENRKSDVKLMTKSGEIKSLMTVAPLYPKGIHVTIDNKVIIGVIEAGNRFILTEKSQRAIVVYGMDGEQQFTYQYDKDGKRLFTVPYKITTNINQDILVIDVTSDKTGRVVTLVREGNVRWVYEGHPEINSTIKFFPSGITATTEGYIIVNDINSHALHVLSENGDVLTCKVMADVGIRYPQGIHIDKGGKLWLGCNSRKDSGATLHIIKYTKFDTGQCLAC